jgi:hypothetical protein
VTSRNRSEAALSAAYSSSDNSIGDLLKSAARPEFLDAVRRTANGDAVFTPRLAALVLDEFRRLSAEPAGAGQRRATAIRTRNRHPSDGRHRHALQADRHEHAALSSKFTWPGCSEWTQDGPFLLQIKPAA